MWEHGLATVSLSLESGDYSDFSPFPPNGKWKHGSLYELVNNKFSDSHFSKIRDSLHNERVADYIKKIILEVCKNEAFKVVNLDKKEYLDSRVYPANERTMLDIIENDNCNGVTTGLFIRMAHSTGSGDFPKSIDSGTWAGDRIIICTLELLEKFRTYSDVSNPSQVTYLIINH